ncbi:MAG: DsbA family oxidoreductase [Proteobacteria bacterium]|nr:DsbA family oxidoreductase [Pseudomonadota bacterium]
MRKNFDIEVQWRAFPLHPETPEEGLPMKEIYAARIIDMPKAMARLKKAAEGLGLPLGKRKKTYNSRRAQELCKWAETQGKGGEFHDTVFRAYFADGKNIAKPGVLKGLVKAVGLPEKEAEEVLKKRTFQEAVDSDWDLAYQLGISSVPTFVLDDEAVVGAQPYEVLEQFLLEKGIKRKEAR